MAHITALLIALTLAGEPAANALCISWCDSPSDRHTCDGAIANPTVRALSAATNLCDALLTATPFLREEGRSAFHAVTTAPANGVAILPVSALCRQRHDHGDANAGRPLPILVLRV